MNRPQVAYFLSGVLAYFPSGAPNAGEAGGRGQFLLNGEVFSESSTDLTTGIPDSHADAKIPPLWAVSVSTVDQISTKRWRTAQSVVIGAPASLDLSCNRSLA